MRLVLSLWMVALLGACSASNMDPERGYRGFLEKIEARDADGAWELLAAETKRQVAAEVLSRSEASGGLIPNDPKGVLFSSASVAKPIERISIKEADGESALLEIGGRALTSEVRMVREDGAWRVQLDTGALFAAADRRAAAVRTAAPAVEPADVAAAQEPTAEPADVAAAQEPTAEPADVAAAQEPTAEATNAPTQPEAAKKAAPDAPER